MLIYIIKGSHVPSSGFQVMIYNKNDIYIIIPINAEHHMYVEQIFFLHFQFDIHMLPGTKRYDRYN